jgi:hypothetical protein
LKAATALASLSSSGLILRAVTKNPQRLARPHSGDWHSALWHVQSCEDQTHDKRHVFRVTFGDYHICFYSSSVGPPDG